MSMSLHFLQQPYPSGFHQQKVWVGPLIYGVFIAFFLNVFQPFGLYYDFPYKIWIISGYGILTALFMLFLTGVVPRFFPRFFEEHHWVVWKHIFYTMLNVICIGTANFIYATIVHQQPFHWDTFLQFVSMTAVVGILPIGASVLLRYNYLSQQHLISAQSLNHQLPNPSPLTTPPVQQLTLVDDKGTPVLTIDPHALYYAVAAQNYVEVYHRTGKTLLRLSLKALEQQLANYDHFLRTHRSYLVNIQHIQQVEGNAQGYRLQLTDTDGTVPVSRSRLAAFQTAFQAS